MKHTNDTPQLPGMGGLAFGGVQLRPMDTGGGGWDLFRPLPKADAEQGNIWETLDACEDAEIHGETVWEDDMKCGWKAAGDRRTALLASRLKIGYDVFAPDEDGNCRRCGEAGRCHCGQTDAEWDAQLGLG